MNLNHSFVEFSYNGNDTIFKNQRFYNILFNVCKNLRILLKPTVTSKMNAIQTLWRIHTGMTPSMKKISPGKYADRKIVVKRLEMDITSRRKIRSLTDDNVSSIFKDIFPDKNQNISRTIQIKKISKWSLDEVKKMKLKLMDNNLYTGEKIWKHFMKWADKKKPKVLTISWKPKYNLYDLLNQYSALH